MIMKNIFYTCIIIAAIAISKSNIYDLPIGVKKSEFQAPSRSLETDIPPKHFRYKP